ncbi:hypothetical protein EV176_001854 [Coemansia sp. RSA 451]|nr:hypothetical protein GGH98_000621 [Coemansia sp. RSA 454]KAJ2278235.1 hypothetical protein EV176_001854 [Coemansia sp. RSA 451]
MRELGFVERKTKARVTYGTVKTRNVSSGQEGVGASDSLVTTPTMPTTPTTPKHKRSLSPGTTPTKRRLVQAPLSFASQPRTLTNPRTTTHRTTTTTTATDRKTQAFLDFGQRPLTASPCPDCGMAFQRGVSADELLHKKHHTAWTHRHSRILVWDTEPVPTVTCTQIKSSSSERFVYGIDPRVSPKRHTQRALRILNHVNEQLGACTLTMHELCDKERKIFVCVASNNRVDGCVLAETISQARRVVPTRLSDSSTVCGLENERAVCGISRIWVATNARRQGVARQMVDVVRSTFAYACRVDLDLVAFTQPTADGRALAERVFGRKDFLVYTEESMIS